MLRSVNLMKCALKTRILLNQSNSSRLLPSRHPLSLTFLSKSFHVQATDCSRSADVSSVDRDLLRLDTEIRKTGRINRREIEDVLEDIREMKKATSSQSLMIIRCCGELVPEETPENRTKLVQEVWKTMESLNVPMDISHYNALLKVYLDNEYKFSPTEFLQELSNKGIEPNRVIYQRLIARYCQDGDIDGATTILQHMKEKGLPINEHVFNALVLGHAQANDMESAEGIIAVMKQAGLEPTDDTFASLMIGYAKNGDIQNVHRIVKECNEKEIFLIDRDFLTVIYTLAANNFVEAIDEIIPHLRKHSGFNQEAVNTILRLVNIGKVDVAYKILQQMARTIRHDDEQAPSGYFFIKQMVQSTTPSETIIKYCNEMTTSGLNKFALLKAVEVALSERNFEKAFDLLEALKESGFPIRQHYFWPFFSGNVTEKEVYDGLKCMMFLEQSPNTETLREYIIPAILNACPTEKTFKVVERLGVHSRLPLSHIVPPTIQYLMTIGDLKGAAKFASRYNVRFFTPSMRRALVDAYLRSKDAASVTRLLGCAGDDVETIREMVGIFLLDVLEHCRDSEKLEYFEPLLKELTIYGLGISNSAAELIQNNLGEQLTPEITNSILQLTSGELVRKVEPRESRRDDTYDQKNVAELEKILEDDKKNGRVNKGLQKTLLTQYCFSKDFEKAEALKADMLKDDFVLGIFLQMALLELYCDCNKVELAREMYTSAQTTQVDFQIEDIKLLKYALLLSNNGYQEEALKVIKCQKRDDRREPRGYIQQVQVWKVLNTFADAGNVALTKDVFQILVDRGLTTVNNVVLGPLIKSHLVNDDVNGALEEFEHCAKEYHAAPWKQELFCRFIKAEDAERLQKVLDVSTDLYGEVNSLYDLVFAFIECGKVRQAKKILDTPGLRARNEKLDHMCERYVTNNRISELEKFVEITRDVFGIDRNALYFHLLKAYCASGDENKALSVWTSLQEENVQPSEELLTYLANFLRKNNKPIPFALPTSSASNAGSSAPATSNQRLTQFRKAIESKQPDSAIKIKEKLESEGRKLTLEDESSLINVLLKADRLNQAVRFTEDMATRGSYPYVRITEALLSKLSAVGDANVILTLKKILPPDAQGKAKLESYLGAAYINSGRGREYFDEYIKKPIEASISEDVVDPNMFIPVSPVTKLLGQHEELLSVVEELASKLQQSKARQNLSCSMWNHHLIKKNFSQAEELFECELKTKERLTFGPILDSIRSNNDIETAEVLWNHVKDSNMHKTSKAVVVNCLIDLHRVSGDLTHSLEILNQSLDKIELGDLKHDQLTELKAAVEKSGEKFPHEIPEKPKRRQRRRSIGNSGSDSDSDSD